MSNTPNLDRVLALARPIENVTIGGYPASVRNLTISGQPAPEWGRTHDYTREEHGRKELVHGYQRALRHALTRHLLDSPHAGDVDPWDVRAAHDSDDPVAALDRLHSEIHAHGLGGGHSYEAPGVVQLHRVIERGRHLGILTAPKGSLPGDRG